MQGGVAGGGAPMGNSNARKLGRYGADAIRARHYVSALLRLARAEVSDTKKVEVRSAIIAMDVSATLPTDERVR
jgi:hypothetical protein